MALTKSTTWSGLKAPNAYAKIQKKEVSDYIVEDVKKYSVNVYVGVYSDSTKENGLYGTTVSFNEIDTPDVTHEDIYAKLKESEEFSGWKDC